MEVLEKRGHFIDVFQYLAYWSDEKELDVEKVREPCSDQQISHGLSIGSFEQHKRLMAGVKICPKALSHPTVEQASAAVHTLSLRTP